MGLRNSDKNINYLRIKEGKFYIGKDTETPYEELEGLITGMRYKDEEYEGTPLRKFILTLTDDGVNYQLGLNVESQNYSSLVSFLRNADLTQPVTLHPKIETQNKDGKEFKRYSILVSQDGTYSKGYFTKATPNGLPAWKTVKVGKKTVTDKSEYIQFLEEFVTRNYIPVVNKGAKQDVAVKSKTDVPDAEAFETADTGVEDGKLPWDD